MELNKYIDHTILKATASQKDIEKLCAEATEHKFYSVCVNGCYVKDAKILGRNRCESCSCSWVPARSNDNSS